MQVRIKKAEVRKLGYFLFLNFTFLLERPEKHSGLFFSVVFLRLRLFLTSSFLILFLRILCEFHKDSIGAVEISNDDRKVIDLLYHR